MGNTHSRGTMSDNNKDVSMIDVRNTNDNDKRGSQRAIVQSFSKLDIGDHDGSRAPLLRRRSTLIFDDDDDAPRHEENVEDQSDLNEFESHISDSSSVASLQQQQQENPSWLKLQAQREQQDQEQQELQLQMEQQQQMKYQAPREPFEDQSGSRSGSEPPVNSNAKVMVPVEITWQQGGSKVYVTGSFTGWRKMIGLLPVADQPGCFHIKLQLPSGTHRFRFIVDNELRFSDFMPTATDQMGNLVNYLEIATPYESEEHLQQQQETLTVDNESHMLQQQVPQPSHKKQFSEPLSARSKLALQIEEEPDDMGDGYSRFHGAKEAKPDLSYTTDIPAVFTDASVMEQYYLTLDQQQTNQQSMAWLTPPQLPPHLENVILNNYSVSSEQGDSGSENNSGSLPIPNHVVLNHLATSSIKHNTLCVASIVRYKRKYATQMLYSPLQ
ncbi:LADA_0G15104g1_1 [Lachancea dasiensis]|uniref:LADA_0G15104g1_1 n=1 Tax=Lachancea dasiensis TaxID=1072105 RepID=A0A1G4JW99_9SACH|nr:LADA_0G15104g1_1 [Lachancea dasiensis]